MATTQKQMSSGEATSSGTLAADMNALSLNGAEEPTVKTTAQLKAEEIIRTVNELMPEKKYSEAVKLLKSMSNKEKRQHKAMIKQLEDKQHEADTGEYDMVGIFHEVVSNPENPTLDHAQFTGPVEKRRSSDQKGFGLVATRDVEPGEFLIASKAFSVACSDLGDDYLEAQLRESTIARIASSEHSAREFYGFYAGQSYRRYDHNEPIPTDVDRRRVARVLKYNAFDFHIKPRRTKGSEPQTGRGLWALPSFINHSCAPNCTRLCFGDFVLVRAQTKISQGEELTLAYVEPASYTDAGEYNYEERRQQLRSGYGFVCACRFCECDKQNLRENPRLNDQRLTLYDDFTAQSQVMPLLGQFTYDQVKAFFMEYVNKFEPLVYKNRYDAGLGVDLHWYARSSNPGSRGNQSSGDVAKAWASLTGENSGNPVFVAAQAMDLLRFCVLGLSILQQQGNAKGPDAIDLAKKLLKYSKIEYGPLKSLEMAELMAPDVQTKVAVDLTRRLLKLP